MKKCPIPYHYAAFFFLSVTESWLIWDQSFSLNFNFYVLIIAFQKYRSYPGYQRLFSRTAGIFGAGRRPKPRAAKRRSGEKKPLAQSGAFYRPRWPLSFLSDYICTPIRLEVSNCDHVDRHVKKCPTNHIILRKTSWSLKFIVLREMMTESHRNYP